MDEISTEWVNFSTKINFNFATSATLLPRVHIISVRVHEKYEDLNLAAKMNSIIVQVFFFGNIEEKSACNLERKWKLKENLLFLLFFCCRLPAIISQAHECRCFSSSRAADSFRDVCALFLVAQIARLFGNDMRWRFIMLTDIDSSGKILNFQFFPSAHAQFFVMFSPPRAQLRSSKKEKLHEKCQKFINIGLMAHTSESERAVAEIWKFNIGKI